MRGSAAALILLVGCVGGETELVIDDDRVLQRNAGSCRIAQTTYPAGAVNPANPCQLCEPSISKKVWSNVPDGSSCNDGNACTGVDSCTAGTCSGPPGTCDDGDECTADSCDPSAGCSFIVDEVCMAVPDLAVGPIEAPPLAPVAGATAEVVVPLANVGVADAEGVALNVSYAAGLSVDLDSVYFETAGWSAGSIIVVPQDFGITTLHFSSIVVSPNAPGVVPTGGAGRLRLTVQVVTDLPPGAFRGMEANAATTNRERVTDNNSHYVTLTAAAP